MTHIEGYDPRCWQELNSLTIGINNKKTVLAPWVST
jgi:hypothetical protein